MKLIEVIIDSSFLIDHLRIKKNGAATKLEKIIETTKVVGFSLISVGELFAGKSAVADQEKISSLLSCGEIIKLDFDLLKTAGLIRAGTDIDLEDAIVAATALRLDLPVATLNIKDFAKVKGLRIFRNLGEN